MDTNFRLHFDGLNAKQHHLPMEQFGTALVGTNRIMVAGLVFLTSGRLPRKKEKFELQIIAQPPREGSVDVFGALEQVPWMLPLLKEFIVQGGAEVAVRFFSYVLLQLGGRPTEANAQMSCITDAMIKINQDNLIARDKSEKRWHQMATTLAGQGPIIAESLRFRAQQAVTPIGRGASELTLGTATIPKLLELDEPMADVIRSKESDEVGDLQEMRIRVDGIIHHSRQLKIDHPQKEGQFLTAEVRDPAFEIVPSKYSNAAANRTELEVLAKPVYRKQELHKLYIMDARE